MDGAPEIEGVDIQYEIGRGGMGVVYRGRQSYVSRDVAVKVLHTKHTGDEFRRRFQREATIQAKLRHPNIVACHQAGVTPEGQCFLVMEFIEGPNLYELIEESGPLDLDHALDVVEELASALKYAQELGVIHRDVKPANVLLRKVDSGRYEAKLVDLGLARPEVAENTMLDITIEGAVLGSPATMAPEQFDSPGDVDYRVDIYGLGCVLFHAVTGRAAYPQKSLTETIARKMQSTSPDPRQLNKTLPKQVASLARACLAKKPEDRPKDYDELIRRVRLVRSGINRGGARSGGRTGKLFAAGLTVVAGGLGLAWHFGLPPFAPQVAQPEDTQVSSQDSPTVDSVPAITDAPPQETMQETRIRQLEEQLQKREEEEARQVRVRLYRASIFDRRMATRARLLPHWIASHLEPVVFSARGALLELSVPRLAEGERRELFSDDLELPFSAPWTFAAGTKEQASLSTGHQKRTVILAPRSSLRPVVERPLPRGSWEMGGRFQLVGSRAVNDANCGVTLVFEAGATLELAQVRDRNSSVLQLKAIPSCAELEGAASELEFDDVNLERHDVGWSTFRLIVDAQGDMEVSWQYSVPGEGEPELTTQTTAIPKSLLGKRGVPTRVQVGCIGLRAEFQEFVLRSVEGK